PVLAGEGVGGPVAAGEGVHEGVQGPADHHEEGIAHRVFLAATQHGVLEDVGDALGIHGYGAQRHQENVFGVVAGQVEVLGASDAMTVFLNGQVERGNGLAADPLEGRVSCTVHSTVEGGAGCRGGCCLGSHGFCHGHRFAVLLLPIPCCQYQLGPVLMLSVRVVSAKSWCRPLVQPARKMTWTAASSRLACLRLSCSCSVCSLRYSSSSSLTLGLTCFNATSLLISPVCTCSIVLRALSMTAFI